MVLSIVTARDVKRYAENSLPESQRLDVELTLLDDDRARELVLQTANHDANSSPSSAMKGALVSALVVCRKCVEDYNAMLRIDEGPPDILSFARKRAAPREELITEISGLLTSDAARTAPPLRAGNGEDAIDCALAVRRVLKRESELAKELRLAFSVTQAPVWKAKTAGWIAQIDNDLFRLTRLAQAFC